MISLYATAATYDLPYGPAYYMTKSPHGDFLVPTNYDKHANKIMNSEESQVVQYLANKNPEALLYFSNFHAGLGQVCFGRTLRRLTDFTLLHSPGNITVIQYHDKSFYKNANSHSEQCQYYNGMNKLEYNYQTLTADDENFRYAVFLTQNIRRLNL